jgi:hypothetical protein
MRSMDIKVVRKAAYAAAIAFCTALFVAVGVIFFSVEVGSMTTQHKAISSERPIPPIDALAHDRIETATFALG